MQFVLFLLIPSIMVSGVFWPLETMPATIRPLSYVSPLTYANAGLRKVMLAGGGFGSAWLTYERCLARFACLPTRVPDLQELVGAQRKLSAPSSPCAARRTPRSARWDLRVRCVVGSTVDGVELTAMEDQLESGPNTASPLIAVP